MNEQAVKVAYNLFVKDGYTKDINSFKTLMQTNEKARTVAHNLFVKDGYTKDINSFSSLMGIGAQPEQQTQSTTIEAPAAEVKKKDVAVPSSSVTPSSSPSSPSPSSGQETANKIYNTLYTKLKANPETADRAETLAKIMTAQAAVEAGTNFDSNLARESNNYSGIKYFGQKDSTASKVKAPSSEEGGKARPYAHYNSMDEWANAHINLIAGGRHKKALEAKSATEYAQLLKQSGYYQADEKDYVAGINAQLRKYGLISQQPAQTQPKQNAFFDNAVNSVTPELVGKEQEEVTAKLNYNLGGYGFKFEATGGSMADAMKVTAPNGKTIDIDLDPFTSAGEKEESAKLKAFIAANKPQQTAIDKIETSYKQAKTKFTSEQDMKNTISSYQTEVDNFKKSVVDFSKRKDKMNPVAAEEERKRLVAQEEAISKKGAQLDKSVGDYTAVLGEQGGFWGAIGKSFLGGVGSIYSGLNEIGTRLNFALTPLSYAAGHQMHQEAFQLAAQDKGVTVPANMNYDQFVKWSDSLKNKDEIESLATDYAQKKILHGEYKKPVNEYSAAASQQLDKKGWSDIYREALPNAFGPSSTSNEYLTSSKRTFIEKALFGAAGSVPAMLGGAASAPLFFMQGFDMVNKEMQDNPAFANVNENEKLLISVPLGIVSGVLEEVGFRGVLNNSSLVTGLTMRALGKATADMTAASFQDVVRTEVKSALARGAITFATSGLAEAETGFAQQLTEDGAKRIYNEIKGKEMFKDVPNDIKGFLSKAKDAGAAEAIGGFVFGSINTGVAMYSKQDYAQMDDKKFNTLLQASQDQNIVDAYMASVDADVSRGNITQAEGQKKKDSYQNVINTLNSIPDNISDDNKKEVMSILARRNELQKRIEGKDPNLVKDEIETIKRLNQSLSTMPRTKYVLNGKDMTRDEFVHGVSQLDADGLQNMQATVENDNKTTQALGELLSIKIPEQGNIEIINGQQKTQEQNAIQEPITTESVLRTEQPQVGLQEMGEGNAQEQAITQEVKPQEEVSITEESLRALPQEVTNDASITLSDGFELPVQGNESFINRTYNDINAKPEGERTDWDNKTLETIQSLFKPQEATTTETAPAEATPTQPTMTDEQLQEQENTLASELKGFDQVMQEVETMRTKRRKGSYQEIMDGIKNYVENTPLFQNANDQQRDQIMRHIDQKVFNQEQKNPPSAKRILGINFNDKETFTVNLYNALKQQLKRDESVAKKAAAEGKKQGVSQTKAEMSETAKAIADDVKEMVSKGVLTVRQASRLVTKFSRVNLYSEKSINKFINYAQNVMNDADYDNKLAILKKNIKTAKKNIKTKLGTRVALMNTVNSILHADPELIPTKVQDKYNRIVDIMSGKGRLLATDDANAMLADANEVVEALKFQDSIVDKLSTMYHQFENKVVDEKTGEVNYKKTVDAMLAGNYISGTEAELMRNFEDTINTQEAKEEAETPVDAKLVSLLKESIDNLRGTVGVENLAMRAERDSAKELLRNLNDNFINSLTVSQAKTLLNALDNIANGIYTSTANDIKDNAIVFNQTEQVSNELKKAKPTTLSFATAKLKSFFVNLFSNKRSTSSIMTRRTPLYFLNSILGIQDNTILQDAIFKMSAVGRAAFQVEYGKVQKRIEAAQTKLARYYGNNINELVKAKMFIYAYLIQNEYESNQGNTKLNPVLDYINATIDQIKRGQSNYTEKEMKVLQDIANLAEDGVLPAKKLYDALTAADMDAVHEIRSIYDSIQDKAIYASAIIRGNPMSPIENYNHLNVTQDVGDNPSIGEPSSEVNDIMNATNPSTKAKSLIARTGAVSALLFDPFSALNKSSKGVLLDYHMTEPIRIARSVLNNVSKNIDITDKSGKLRGEIFNAIQDAYHSVVSNVLINLHNEDSFADEAMRYINRAGYRTILASLPRFGAELTSNIGFAINNPIIFAKGIQLFDVTSKHNAANIMVNSGSVNAERLYSSEELSGRFIDNSLLSQKSGLGRTTLSGGISNTAEQFYNNTIKKYKNAVEFLADTMIASPDKLVGRPVWFGAYATKFKEVTGVEPDFDKIAENNEQYMNANRKAIAEATKFADMKSVEASASNNEFLGMLKGTSVKNQGLATQAFNTFNNFLTKFTMYEYFQARKAIYAMMGSGEISRVEGAKLMAAIVTRMTTYTLLSKMLGGMFTAGVSKLVKKLFGDDDEEEKKKEEEKSLKQNLESAFISTGTQLILGRDFGNFPRAVINYGMENVNEKYFDFLRNGKYDPYTDQLGYSPFRSGEKGKPKQLADYIVDMSGAYAPAIKTGELIFQQATSKKKKLTKKDEYTNKVRIPIEVLGNAGYIPLYKDVRRVMFDMMPKDISFKFNAKGMDKADLKRYFPDIYESLYGESSPSYESQQQMKEQRKEINQEKRKAKDEAFGYSGD